MVTVSVNIREGAVSRQVRITAESIWHALEVAGEAGRKRRGRLPNRPGGLFRCGRSGGRAPPCGGEVMVRALEALELVGICPRPSFLLWDEAGWRKIPGKPVEVKGGDIPAHDVC
jgi:hypothetical protein